MSPAARQSTPWLQISSAHFTVVTDAGEKKGRDIALRFEQMRGVFADLLSRDHLHQSVPLTIFAFGDDRWFYQAAPLDQGRPIEVPGFVLTGDDQDFVVLNASEEDAWRATAHDYVLMLLRYNYPPVQSWFDEGLAQCFRSIRMDGKQIDLGADSAITKGTSAVQSFTSLLSTTPWIPLADFFATKPEANRGLYQAESWILMNYLIHEKKLPETGTYFGLAMNRGIPIEDAIKQAYGMSSAQLEDAVKSYFRSETAGNSSQPAAPGSPLRPPFSESFSSTVTADDSTMISKPLPESDARAMHADIQVRVPDRRELGLKTLHELASTPTEADKKLEGKTTKRIGEDPNQLPTNAVGSPIAHRILAWDHIQRGEFDEAFAEIKDASALNPNDMWLRYYLSAAKYRMAQAKHTDILGLANMMLDMKTVLEWYPDMAGAYDLLAVARNAGGGPSAALQAERAAIALSPRDERYSLHLAQIYVASKNWEAANTLLNRLKENPDKQIAAAAAELQSQAGAERRYGIPVAGVQSKFEEQKSPFDVLEQDAAKRASGGNAQPAPAGDPRSTKFLKGRLLSVDCSDSPAAVLSVSSGSSVLRLHVADYKSVLLIGADDFSCDWHDVAVTVNYKPGKGGEGDLVSLEMR